MTFSISTVDGGIIRLAIGGELDVVTVPQLRGELEKLLARRPDRVEVDLSSLRMIDSSGVGALVSLYKKVRAQGGDMIVTGLRDQPLAIFRLLRLTGDRGGGGGGAAPAELAIPLSWHRKVTNN
jgi:anti-sigma B factor antagonist